MAGSGRVGFLVLEIVVDKGRPKAAADDEADYAGTHNIVDPSLLRSKRCGRPITATAVS